MNRKPEKVLLAGSTMVKLVLVTVMVLSVTACSRSNNLRDLEQFVASAKSMPGGEVDPVPEFIPYEGFIYSAASLRSPFSKPVIAKLSDASVAAANVKPDLNRIKEALEDHSLSELSMVGMLTRDRSFHALVEDGGGILHRISVGNYLGRNHGRVEYISESQLNITEIVPSGDGGWIQRPQILALQQ